MSAPFDPRFPLALLRALGALYRAVSGLRTRLYDRGTLRAHAAGLPVVSIGNLTFGGSGKTPAALWLTNALADRGERVGLVSRGYGGRRAAEPLVVAREGALLATADESGDEPYLLASQSRAHVVVVGADRLVAARRARDEGAGMVLLDDGFQHRRLARDLDVVLVDHAWAGRPRAERAVDLLREPLSGLRRAGIVIVTHAPPELLAERGALPAAAWPLRVARVLSSTARPPLVAAAAHRATSVTLPGGTTVPPAALAGRLVLAVSGIARPETFEALLRAEQAIVASHVVFPDHHRFGPGDAATITRRAREAGEALIVTTAKDRTRWPAGAPEPAVLHVAFDVPAAEAVVERVMEAVRNRR